MNEIKHVVIITLHNTLYQMDYYNVLFEDILIQKGWDGMKVCK